MTKQEEQERHNKRTQEAASIFAKPHLYKVCDQCRSICIKACPACPMCHAYRWLDTDADVQETALALSMTTFPVTFGVVPRILPRTVKK